jgi:hypothetical protein
VSPINNNSARPLVFEFKTDEGSFIFDEEVFEISQPKIPKLSAYNQEIEKYRLDRLVCAWGAASAAVNLMSDKYQSRWNGAIIYLRDHKGALRIIWRDRQSRIMFEGVIVGAWERYGERWCTHGLSANSSPICPRG